MSTSTPTPGRSQGKQATTPSSSSRPQRATSNKPPTPQINKPITDAQKTLYCFTEDPKINEQLLMLAFANIGDNLHDFAGSRSHLADNKILAITAEYITFLTKAKDAEAIQTKRQLYSELITKINTSLTIDKDLKIIYAHYFNNTKTEPELEWSSLSQPTTITDNFEVIIGNKKTLLNLTTPAANNFLNTLRPIIKSNEYFKGKKIHFVIDVSTIGNNVFTDGESKICKGTANYFDDFYRPPTPPSIADDDRYIFEEIDFNVNILDTISKKNGCKLNHLTLTDFRIEDKKIKWRKNNDTNSNIIDIDSTTPNEFGVSKYSTLILESAKKKPTNEELLKRFKDITGLDNALIKSVDYGRCIFDFKRLMDSSQIMYTYHLNKENQDTKYIFVTHDNMAAVIARIIGVPYIHTHINGSIRSISVHLGTSNIISPETINTIQEAIFTNVQQACEKYREAYLTNISSKLDKQDYTDIQNKAENDVYEDFRIKLLFKWISDGYIRFLTRAKSSLEKYINTVNSILQKSYDAFKQLKDTKQILNINYTTDSLNQEHIYIDNLIKRFNSLQATSSVIDFYNAIQDDSGYIFSTLDFKMLIYCLFTDKEKADIQPDFDTTYYDGINLTAAKDKINSVSSNKISLRRFFKKIIELSPLVVVSKPRSPPYKQPRWQGGMENEYVELVEAFIDSVKDKNSLKAYSEAINSRKVGASTTPQQTPPLVHTTGYDTVMTAVTDTSPMPSPGTQGQKTPQHTPPSRTYTRSIYSHLPIRSRSRSRIRQHRRSRMYIVGGTQRFQFYEEFLNKLKL